MFLVDLLVLLSYVAYWGSWRSCRRSPQSDWEPTLTPYFGLLLPGIVALGDWAALGVLCFPWMGYYAAWPGQIRWLKWSCHLVALLCPLYFRDFAFSWLPALMLLLLVLRRRWEDLPGYRVPIPLWTWNGLLIQLSFLIVSGWLWSLTRSDLKSTLEVSLPWALLLSWFLLVVPWVRLCELVSGTRWSLLLGPLIGSLSLLFLGLSATKWPHTQQSFLPIFLLGGLLGCLTGGLDSRHLVGAQRKVWASHQLGVRLVVSLGFVLLLFELICGGKFLAPPGCEEPDPADPPLAFISRRVFASSPQAVLSPLPLARELSLFRNSMSLRRFVVAQCPRVLQSDSELHPGFTSFLELHRERLEVGRIRAFLGSDPGYPQNLFDLSEELTPDWCLEFELSSLELYRARLEIDRYFYRHQTVPADVGRLPGWVRRAFGRCFAYQRVDTSHFLLVR